MVALGLESTWVAAKLSALYELLEGHVVTAHDSDRWSDAHSERGLSDAAGAELLKTP